MRLIGFRIPIPEGYFRMLTASWLQAPVLDALYYEDPDAPVISAIKFEFNAEAEEE